MNDEKILVYRSNSSHLVWKIDDIRILRSVYRIVGSFIGCNVASPFQSSSCGLPLKLTAEEIMLLHHEGVIRLVTSSRLKSLPSEEERTHYKDYLEKNKDEQNRKYKEIRKKTLMEMSDEIMAGYVKRKAGSSMSKRQLRKMKHNKQIHCASDITSQLSLDENSSVSAETDYPKEEIMSNLISRIPDLTENSFIKHIPTECPWLHNCDIEDVEWNYPTDRREIIRCLVFKDLWKRNFYITQGTSFGGDFLIYPGDPVQFHAMYIAICVDFDDDLCGKDIIRMGRMGNNVKKTTVLCSVDDENKVQYFSINFCPFHWKL